MGLEDVVQAIANDAYREDKMLEGFIHYDEMVARVVDPIWERDYLRSDGRERQASSG